MANVIRFGSSYIEPYPLQVQGESYYRKNIESITNYTGEDEGIDADDFIAQLILDDNNEHDPGNAVRVEIDGNTVGHLAKPAAKKYRARLKQLNLSAVLGECYASIKGGFTLREGGQADFGVRLDLDLDTFSEVQATRPRPEPIMPPTPQTEPAIETVSPMPAPTSKAPSAADIKTRRILIFTSVSFAACCVFLAAVRILAR